MIQTDYPSARTAAQRVVSHLTASEELPDVDVIEAMIHAAFWTSLRREEGHTPKVSLAFVPPTLTPTAMIFDRPISFEALPLTRVGVAVERPGLHLGVWREGDELFVWGATRTLPPCCFVLEVIAPGLLIIKQSRGEDSGKFINVAVLEADQIKVIDQQAATVPDCPALLTSLLGLESQFASSHSVNVLIQLAVSTRAHGRGGTLLVVPTGAEKWRQSILAPITYSVAPAFSGLADLMQQDPNERPRSRWRDALRQAVDAIAGLTAVDGAKIITDRYELLAFGAKIVRRTERPLIDKVIVTEPIEGASAMIIEPAQLGGTRHLSAAQFVHDQQDAIALVASQDGRFTVFAWSPCEGMVHAHRIETLLL
ncbi:MAG TPA: hypothetical protein VEX68_20095 [Bryobacteraceae bacterium]|nr:hypothetical protein [Bryobacteraceae bacterium]